jgi:hypothetical protein
MCLGAWLNACVQVRLIKEANVPTAVRGVIFARQQPFSGVKPHSDGRNFILTCHLGLKIPPKCWIEVGNERRQWEEGKAIVLDTSFVHSTGNESNNDRFVLIIDFWHPDLTAAEREALEFIYDTRNKVENNRFAEISTTFWNTVEEADVPVPQANSGLIAWFQNLLGGRQE